jgi:RNA polymerase-interacting CarD/CdnL/TRCF family regulator
MSAPDSELFTNYWSSYISWRTGQSDVATITNTVRSIWEHINRNQLASSEVEKLKKLARLIEEELAAVDDEDEITWVA